MTQPPEPDQPDERSAIPAARTLRDELLDYLQRDCLSLGHIDSIAAHDYSAEQLARQELVMATIRSLLTDGLVVMGQIVGGTDATVEPWKLSFEEAMQRLHERYVIHYDDWDAWGWTTWFALTESGTIAAEAIEA